MATIVGKSLLFFFIKALEFCMQCLYSASTVRMNVHKSLSCKNCVNKWKLFTNLSPT